MSLDYSQTHTKDNKVANLQSRRESLGRLLRFHVYEVTSAFSRVIHHKTGFNYMDSLNNLRGLAGRWFSGSDARGGLVPVSWKESLLMSTRGQEEPATAETPQVRFHLYRRRFKYRQRKSLVKNSLQKT